MLLYTYIIIILFKSNSNNIIVTLSLKLRFGRLRRRAVRVDINQFITIIQSVRRVR